MRSVCCCQTTGFPGYWVVRVLSCQTTGSSKYWVVSEELSDYRPVTVHTTELSDYRVVRL